MEEFRTVVNSRRGYKQRRGNTLSNKRKERAMWMLETINELKLDFYNQIKIQNLLESTKKAGYKMMKFTFTRINYYWINIL
jgi:hypothetical protein